MNARVCVCKRERGRERERDSNFVLVVEGKVLNYKCAHYCEVKKKKGKKEADTVDRTWRLLGISREGVYAMTPASHSPTGNPPKVGVSGRHDPSLNDVGHLLAYLWGWRCAKMQPT